MRWAVRTKGGAISHANSDASTRQVTQRPAIGSKGKRYRRGRLDHDGSSNRVMLRPATKHSRMRINRSGEHASDESMRFELRNRTVTSNNHDIELII